MYLEHYGLRELPFTITPDTSFFFNHPSHQQALNVLLVALRSGEGFIKITGEVGTGKTLICRKLLNLLGEDSKFVTAYIPNPNLTPASLNMALAGELGIEFARNIGQHRLLQMISDRLIELTARGKRVVLLIDEAQAMPEASMEALRLLTNLETEKYKLLQIVMFGQPELNVILRRPSIRQLRQRIVFSHELPPMNSEAVEAYLAHRVTVAGYNGTGLFEPSAIRLLHKASRGVPRLINILAHKSLIVGYGQGVRRVGVRQARAAVQDTDDTRQGAQGGWLRMLGIITSILIGLGLFFYLGLTR